MALEMQGKLSELQPLWREAGLGESLAVRMGIASGPCFVGNFGAEQQLSYTVLGTPANLAARLQVRAQPGQVLICSATRDLVQGQIECVANAPFVAHGLTGEIANYSAVLR
jgi:class 3 adenylate cyclase